LKGLGQQYMNAVNEYRPLPIPLIEQWIYNLQLRAGRPYVAPTAAPPWTAWFHAGCVKVRCGGKDYCVGVDKIGHFFQQGYILFRLYHALSERFPALPPPALTLIVSVVVNGWTEGFRFGPLDTIVFPAIQLLGPVYFPGYGTIRPSDWYSLWGGFGIPGCPFGFCAAMSVGDLAANFSGFAFWQGLMKDPVAFMRKGFDICNYLPQYWLESRP
jgi:hypothetical protein